MNYNAYGLESSRTPSYVSTSIGGVKVSNRSIAAPDGAAVKSTTITKMETVVIKTEEKKEEKEEKEEQQEPAAIEELATVEKKEQEQEQEQEQDQEQEQEQEKEQEKEQMEAETVAEE